MPYEALIDFSKYKKGHIFPDDHGAEIAQMFITPHVKKLESPKEEERKPEVKEDGQKVHEKKDDKPAKGNKNK
jgi:hypothetical protein